MLFVNLGINLDLLDKEDVFLRDIFDFNLLEERYNDSNSVLKS